LIRRTEWNRSADAVEKSSPRFWFYGLTKPWQIADNL